MRPSQSLFAHTNSETESASNYRKVLQSVKKRSLIIGGHRTSVSLEDAFWDELKLMAKAESRSLASLISDIDDQRTTNNLSSSLRLAVLSHLKKNQVK